MHSLQRSHYAGTLLSDLALAFAYSKNPKLELALGGRPLGGVGGLSSLMACCVQWPTRRHSVKALAPTNMIARHVSFLPPSAYKLHSEMPRTERA